MTLIYSEEKVKYVVQAAWEWQVSSEIKISEAFDNGYHYATVEGRIGAHVGCRWDGATKFPDRSWILEASLGHDILHWLIRDGVIDECHNNDIDRELSNIIMARAPAPFGWRWRLKWRAWMVKRATNIVDQEMGEQAEIKVVTRNKHFKKHFNSLNR